MFQLAGVLRSENEDDDQYNPLIGSLTVSSILYLNG